MTSALDLPLHNHFDDFAFEDVLFPESPRNLSESDDENYFSADELMGKTEDVFIDPDSEGDFSVSFKSNAFPTPTSKTTVGLEDFEVLNLVGKGAYGKVHQVRKKDSGQIYAMKVLRKEHLIQTNNVTYTMTERNILRNIRHPFIASLHYAFQTQGKVYLVMEFLNGGQLFFHMREHAMFSEDSVRIYAAELVLALEYLHSLDVVHRDIKPENILVSSDGHLCIADFGLAKINVTDQTSKTFCGTIEYMAPEIIKGAGHGKAVDWWSLGILIYDMLTGSPPFQAKQRNVLQKEILRGKFKLPSYLSPSTHSLIKGLLTVSSEKRLGYKGAGQIKNHAFFKGIDWQELLSKNITPPIRPTVIDGLLDTSYFDPKFLKLKPGDSPLDECPLVGDDHFLGFSYVRSFGDHHDFIPTSH